MGRPGLQPLVGHEDELVSLLVRIGKL